jgi:methionyl-tRNA formyltransferase
MKIVLFADQNVGLEIASFLLDNYPHDLVQVVTMGENDIFLKSLARNVPVYIFDTDEKLAKHLIEAQLDFGILAWWPKIIKASLLKLPKFGFINTHPSFLPYNRGKHYNFWAIVEEAPFGVSLHFVDEGIDSGDVIAQSLIPYDWCDNGISLYQKAQNAMVELFCTNYPRLREGRFSRYPQNLKCGSFHKASELEMASHIDLDAQYRGRDIINLLRAKTFPGYSGCWFEENGIRYEIHIDIRRLQIE